MRSTRLEFRSYKSSSVILIALRIQPTACGLPRKGNTTRPHKPFNNSTLSSSEVITGFNAQGIHRIYCVVRTSSHQILMFTITYKEIGYIFDSRVMQ